MTASQLRPLDFGEIFATTFSLIGRTLPVFLLCLGLFLAGFVLYSGNMIEYMRVAAEGAEKGLLGPDAPPEQAAEFGRVLLSAMVPMLMFSFLVAVIAQFMQVAVTIASWETFNGRSASLGTVLAAAFRRPFWSSLLQMLAIGLVIVVLLFLFVIVAALALGGRMEASGPTFGLVLLLCTLYPTVATSLRVHKTVGESRGPWQGMIASIALVNSRFMKIFGLLLLTGIGWAAIYFIVATLLGIPMPSPGGNNDPDQIVKLYNDMAARSSIGYTLVSGGLTALGLLFTFYLLTPIYVDLRARRGEFDLTDEADVIEHE